MLFKNFTIFYLKETGLSFMNMNQSCAKNEPLCKNKTDNLQISIYCVKTIMFSLKFD